MSTVFSPFEGAWTYRSFLRNPDVDTEFNDLRFGLGTLVLHEPVRGEVSGHLGGPGWQLELKGWATHGNPGQLRFQGIGEIDGEPWVYDYLGYFSPAWPNGVDERPAIVGTIVRTVAHSHGQSPAGVVASWIAVKQEQ
ncbi:hypothetical protein [Pseudomonas sp. CAM1A]|uniref:hypothetical protein n=1 Tax=Pseudomonas sp. CAM1A TaxID=3231717 RepID=UPI0039C75156